MSARKIIYYCGILIIFCFSFLFYLLGNNTFVSSTLFNFKQSSYKVVITKGDGVIIVNDKESNVSTSNSQRKQKPPSSGEKNAQQQIAKDGTGLQNEEDPLIVLKADGLIDTIKTRIDFFKDTWYDEFKKIQKKIESYEYISENAINAKVRETGGYSLANLTNVYAVITNACIRRPFSTIQLYEKEKNKIKNEVTKRFKMKSFYYNNVMSESKPIEVSNVDFSDEHTLVLHPRQYTNIFHVLEGTSVILFVATHPELFPKIKNIILVQQPIYSPDSWTLVIEQLLLEVFPESRRPMYGFDESLKIKCDRSMVVAKSWEPQGTGSFISEPLAADLLRAVAYKMIGWSVTKPVDKKLNALFIKRVTKRKILNSDEVHEALVNQFGDKLNLTYPVLDSWNAYQQIHLFANMDIVVAAHGAGLTNIIFMRPKSYLFELFPPFWQFACYRRLAENLGLQYAKITAEGVKGPECSRDEKSLNCQYAGIRDRDFTIDVNLVIKGVDIAISAVQKSKYPDFKF